MNRSELERPSSGEAYVSGPGWFRIDDTLFMLTNNCAEALKLEDSPSAPVQPLNIGFSRNE